MSQIIHVPVDDQLPSNAQWENRFEIESSSSNRVYIIAQNKAKRFWSCSYPAWRRWRKCHHLQEIGLPCFEQPHEAILEGGR